MSPEERSKAPVVASWLDMQSGSIEYCIILIYRHLLYFVKIYIYIYVCERER